MEKQHIGTFSFSREWQRIETRNGGKTHPRLSPTRTARHACTERAKNIAKSDKVGQPDIAV
jgi:hypothetical protein